MQKRITYQKNIITFLERLSKVDNTPFDKLYFLAESCADHYYTSIIKTFAEIIKQSVTDRQIVLVNMARALKYLEDFGQRQLQLFMVLEKYHLLLDNLENLHSQFGFLNHFQECQAFTTSDNCLTNIHCQFVYLH